jgi:hypothetical protein
VKALTRAGEGVQMLRGEEILYWRGDAF